MVTVDGPHEIDGYHALLLQVSPLQYRAKSKLLTAFPRVEVDLEFTERDASLSGADALESREAFGNLFLNPRRGVALRLDMPTVPIHLPNGPELLIVYATMFASAAQRLAQWKNRRGLITELLEFKNDISTPDKAAAAYTALKSAIRTRRAKLGARLRYVLLLGDIDDIPNEERGGTTTDYYYSTKVDYVDGQPIPMPWLALGRIPVRDNDEALAVVDQIVAYERTPPADPAYYHRFVAAAHFETQLVTSPGMTKSVDQRDYAFTMETIRAFLEAQGWRAERVYTCDTKITSRNPLYYMNGIAVPADVVADLTVPTAATQRLVDATTEGHLIIGHRDHGEANGWHMPPFRLPDLDRIRGTMPSIIYSVNCLTGAFQSTTTDETFAEKILRLPGTAPTLLAATELSSTWRNNAMMLGLFDAMYGGLLPTFPGTTISYPIRFNRFGDILNYARAYVLSAFRSEPLAVLTNYEMYHVLGDPSLEVWANEPRPLRVIASRPFPEPMQVLIELSAPAPNCVVTLWQGDTLFKRLTPAGQRVVVSLPAGSPLPDLTVCAWAPGFRFAETNIGDNDKDSPRPPKWRVVTRMLGLGR